MTEIIKQISAAEFSADNLTHSIDAATLAVTAVINTVDGNANRPAGA